jgi:hypothetical protein
LIRQPDINQVSFKALTANLPANGGPNATVDALRPFKGFTQILYRLSDANSNYHGMQLYAAKRKGNLELTAGYTWSKVLTDTSGNGDGVDVGEDPFNRHSNYGVATFDRRHIFVTTYDYLLPWFSKMKGVGGAVLSGWEISGITRYQSGAPLTVTANTAIGTRRADYVGGDVRAASFGPLNQWISETAFAAAPATRRGNSGVGIVQGPNLQTWDFRCARRSRYPNASTFASRRTCSMLSTGLTFRPPATVLTTAGFGRITTAGPLVIFSLVEAEFLNEDPFLSASSALPLCYRSGAYG